MRQGDTPEELWHRDLGPMGLQLLAAVLADLDRGTAKREPQDARFATWEPAFTAKGLADA